MFATKGAASHVYIQAVPIPTGEKARGARILIKSQARRLGMTLSTVQNDQDLWQALGKGTKQYTLCLTKVNAAYRFNSEEINSEEIWFLCLH